MKARLLKNGILLIFNKKKYHGNPQIVDKEMINDSELIDKRFFETHQ